MKDNNTALKSSMKDILKTVLVLVIIACVSGGLLGAINAVTYMSEDEILGKKLSKVYVCDAIENIINSEDSEYAEMKTKLQEYNESEGTNKSLVILPKKDNKVEEGKVIYRVYGAGDYDCTLLVLVVDNKIDNVAVYQSSATPGIGDKAYKDDYINQFKGTNLLTANPFKVEKKPAEGEFQSVAGATKSSNAVNSALNKVMELHKLLFSNKGVEA